MRETLIHFGLSRTDAKLNPGLVAFGSGYLIAYRHDRLWYDYPDGYTVNGREFWGSQQVEIMELDRNFGLTGRILNHREGQDPRLFRAYDKIWCSYASCPRGWRWWLMEVDMAHHHERLGEPFLPDYMRNKYVIGGPDEKNWTWIDSPSGSTFDCVYSWEPFIGLRFAARGDLVERRCVPEWAQKWKYGPIHGGSPSVLLPSGERFTAFQSHVRVGEAKCYFVGGLFQEPMWPYRPIRMTPPLIVGRRRFSRWRHLNCRWRHRVAYPCGVVAEPERLLISYGVDDCQCAIAEFTYNELNDYGITNDSRSPSGLRPDAGPARY